MQRLALNGCRVTMVAAGLCLCLSMCQAQPTPPVMPHVEEVQLPPPVELPGPPSPSAEVPQRPLTAAEAVMIALHHHPALTVATARVNSAAAVTEQVRSDLKPTVAVGASYTQVDNSSSGSGGSSGLSSGSQLSASVQQLIYDFNHTRDLVRQAMAEERYADAALTQVQADLVLQVKQAFYAYLQNVRLVQVSESNVQNQQAHLELAQARLKSGLGLPLDVVRAQAAVSDAVYGLVAMRNQAAVASVNLAELMGIDPRTPIEPADTGETPLNYESVPQLVEQALERRPEMLQAEANIEAATHGLSAARTGNAPVVTGSAGVQRRGNDFPPDNNALTVGVTVQWYPFDSGLTAGRIKQAEAGLQTAQAQLVQTRLSVVSDVSQAYLNLQTAERNVATAEAQIVNAREALRLAEGRYRSGIGVFLDVLDAQTNLDAANTNHVNALSGVDQARAALAHAIGNEEPEPG